MTVKIDNDPKLQKMLALVRDMLVHDESLIAILNFKPRIIERKRLSVEFDMLEMFAGPEGDVHNSILATVLDTIMGFTTFSALDELVPIATVNLHTDYFDCAAPGGRAVCTATCAELRGDIAYVVGEIRDAASDALLAAASGSFMVGTRKSSPGSAF